MENIRHVSKHGVTENKLSKLFTYFFGAVSDLVSKN